jgi:Subtilase family
MYKHKNRVLMRKKQLAFSIALPLLFIAFVGLPRLSQFSLPFINHPSTAHSGDESDATVTANDDTSGTSYSINHSNSSLASHNAPLDQQTPITHAPKQVSRLKTPPPKQQTITYNNKTYPVHVYATLADVNDPFYSYQWYGTSTNLPLSWDVPARKQTTLAIIDTGIALQHEEFNNRWYTNNGESGATTPQNPSKLNCTGRGLSLNYNCNLVDDDVDGIVDNENGAAPYENPSQLNCTAQGKSIDKNCNLVDDDGNGLVDDVSGWDFVNGDRSTQAGQLSPSGTGTTHATLVAGVAAASGNNSTGIAGVDWYTKILPIQAIDDDSYGDTRTVGLAIRYAADQGADVINLSLGTQYPDQFVRDSVAYAIAKGSIIVAAAGNDDCNCMVYPGAYEEVVSVGALDTNNTRASFSSYGSSLDISAPGVSIAGPTWTSNNGSSAYVAGSAGTSFAAPIVAGTLSRMSGASDPLSASQRIAMLTENANRTNLASTPIRDLYRGFGNLEINQSIRRVINPVQTEQRYSLSPVYSGNYPALFPSESSSSYANDCQGVILPTTPLYELVRGSERFFTISEVENVQAKANGYQSTFVSYVCQPIAIDGFTADRSINLFREIRNMNIRL